MRKLIIGLLCALWASGAAAQTMTNIPNLAAASASSGADIFPVSQAGGNAKKQTLSAVFAAPPTLGNTTPNSGAFTILNAATATITGSLTAVNLGSAALTNTGTSGAVLGLLNGGLTFSGNNIFNGTSAFNNTISGTGISTFLASPPAIGGTAPATATFTSITAAGTITTGITGSVECVHANTSGVLSGTGSDCGSGSGAVTSVSGTAGQITSSPTTGAVVISLPGTITQAEIFSGAVTLASTVSGTGINAYLASPPAIGGTAPATGTFTSVTSGTGTFTGPLTAVNLGSAALTNTGTSGATLGLLNGTLTFSGPITFSNSLTLSGLNTATVNSYVGVNGSNQLVLGAGGTGGITSISATDGTHTNTATLLSFGAGFVVGQAGAGTATVNQSVPDTTHSSSATLANIAGQDNFTGASLTATVPGTATLGANQTMLVTNQGTPVLTLVNSQTINGLGLATKLHGFGFYSYTGNGTTADAFGFPGFDTPVNANSVSMFVDGSGAQTSSEISDAAGGGVTVGSPTGGQKGAGTLNATALYVNGAAVSAGSGTVNPGTATFLGFYATTGSAVSANTETTVSGASLTIGDASTVGTATIFGPGGHKFNIVGGTGAGADETFFLPINAMASAQIPIGQGTNVWAWETIAGDCTLANNGNVVCGSPIAKTNTTNNWTAAQRGSPVTLSGATMTPNFDTAQNFQLKLATGATNTLANPGTPATLVPGQSGMFEIVRNTTSDAIGTWGTDYIYVGGTSTIALSTGATNVFDYLPYYVSINGTSIMLGGINKGPTH